MFLSDEDYSIMYSEKLLVFKQFDTCTRDGLQDWILQAAQGGCAGSILVGFQDPTEQRPQQCGLISQLVLLCVGMH